MHCLSVEEEHRQRTGYTLADFVPLTDLDESYIEENLVFGISYKSIFEFAETFLVT